MLPFEAISMHKQPHSAHILHIFLFQSVFVFHFVSEFQSASQFLVVFLFVSLFPFVYTSATFFEFSWLHSSVESFVFFPVFYTRLIIIFFNNFTLIQNCISKCLQVITNICRGSCEPIYYIYVTWVEGHVNLYYIYVTWVEGHVNLYYIYVTW
jgi:hypothetical protein